MTEQDLKKEIEGKIKELEISLKMNKKSKPKYLYQLGVIRR
jgi:hypothetical protein